MGSRNKFSKTALMTRFFKEHAARLRTRVVLTGVAAAAFLAVSFLIVLPAVTLDTADDSTLYLSTDYSLELYPEGTDSQVQYVDMKDTERITFNAGNTLLGDWTWKVYSWQDNDWFTFYGEQQSSCTLYAAKLSDMLNDENQALVQLEASLDGVSYTSSQVLITVQPPTVSISQSAPIRQVVSEAAASEQAESQAVENSQEEGESLIMGASLDDEDDLIMGASLDDEDDLIMGASMDDEDDPDGQDSVVKTETSDDNSVVSSQCTIEIRYTYQDGSTAEHLWQGTYSYGYSTNGQTVAVPEILGYQATWNGEDITEFALPETITESMTYTVVYRPAEVTYKVEFWLQDVASTEYTLDEDNSFTATGLTESVVEDPLQTYTGFTARSYDLPVIAADGSTVLRIQYDRNYYKILFELDGGTGVTNYYGQYGQTLQIQDPVKIGYTFLGWFSDEERTVPAAIPDTIPANGLTFYAGWQASETTYSILIWMESGNGTDLLYSGRIQNTGMTGETVTYADIEDQIEAYLSDNSLTQYYSVDTSKVTEEVLAGDGSTGYNIYLNRNSFAIRFIYARSDEQGTSWQVPSNNNTWSKDTSYGTGQEMDAIDGGVSWTSVNNAVTFTDNFSDKIISSFSASDKEGIVTGSITYGGYIYYYIDICQGWDEDLTTIWPSSPFEDNGDYKFVSWGAYKGSPYFSSKAYTNSGGNPNIKGVYGSMDEIMVPTWATAVEFSESGADYSPAQTFVAYWRTGSEIYTYCYEIYAEALSTDSEDDIVYYDGQGVTTGEAGNYTLLYSLYVRSTDVITGQTILNFLGLDNSKAGVVTISEDGKTDTNGTVQFYYPRTRYTLSLFNGYHSTIDIQIPYGENFSTYTVTSYTWIYGNDASTVLLDEPTAVADLQPIYPLSLPEGGYEFTGEWYLDLPVDQDGNIIYDEDLLYTLAGDTMEAQNLFLYARWKVKDITLSFWQDYTKSVLLAQETIPWNTLVPNPYALEDPPYPQWGSRIFDYWYYFSTVSSDDSTDTAATDQSQNGMSVQKLSFTTTYLQEDTDIYAMWSEDFNMDYTVHYVAQDDDGNQTSIAEDTSDSDRADSTVTFEAKTGEALYEAYQTGYYPLTASSSIVLDSTLENPDLEYTFVYKKADHVPYKVQYLEVANDGNDQPVTDANGEYVIVGNAAAESIVMDNSQAVVTETHLDLDGYVLVNNEYQITRILTYSPDAVIAENTLTFYYMKTENAVPYTVEHYIQTLDGSFTLAASFSSTGLPGTEVQAIEGVYEGYNFNPDFQGTVLNGVLSADETLVLKLFYEAMPVTLIKSWTSIQEEEIQTVYLDVYTVDAQSNATLLESASAIPIDEASSWQTTIYLPWPSENTSYALIEENTGSWKADYLPAKTIFIDGKETKAAGIEVLNGAAQDVEIKNSQTFALPSTGGTNSLFKAGILLCTGAAAALGILKVWQRRKKRKKQKARRRKI